MIIPLLRN
jgi:hypothetical protein